MATVFSIVEAAIADDLMKRFPNEFDFDAMLRKVCEDAGVDVETETENCAIAQGLDLDASQRYKLKGMWQSMEKAYKHLVTTLALYGNRHSDDVLNQDIDLKTENLFDLINNTTSTNEDKESGKKEGKKFPTRNILTNSENKRVRRPRKSAVQNRKVDYTREKSPEKNEENNDKINTEDDCNEKDVGTSETATSSEIPQEIDNEDHLDNEGVNVDGKENDNNEDDSDELCKEEVKDHDSTEKKEDSGQSVTRRRGRPKVYNDDGVAEFPCSQCSFIAKKRAKLRTHMLRMHLSTPSSCDMCDKVFPNKRYMMRHRASHGGPQHCCDVCGKMYKIRKAMLDHRKTHDSNYQKPSYKCIECPKSFCNQYILDCHVRDVHQGMKKSYLCSICGKSFTTKHSLTEHSNAHSGVKPHACEICGKTFSYESALRDHRFSHMESKNFWCKHCQKGFSQRSGLKMHMRTHRLNKMFVCTECGRGFTQKQALQRHERVHKGEKPFVCKHCSRFFTDASIIRRHLILVHKIHKSAATWREDIICTVVANTDHHVQKIGDEDKLQMVEKQKKDFLQLVGEKNRPQNMKGPSRAFHRKYPRRVAVLDEDGNVIAPPEVSTSSVSAKLNFNNKFDPATSTFQIKPFQPQSPPGTSIILTPETAGNLDATHVFQQWDALASQLSKENGTHIEHIILDDTGQHDIHKSLDQVHGIHKIIKYETTHNAQLDSNAQSNVLNPGDYQTCPSPRSSPVSFNSLSTPQSRVLETQFEPLGTQITHAGSQYYDNRPNNHSNAQWSSMYYYTQLATLGINSDYSYMNANGTSSSHLGGPYVTHSSADSQSGTTTLILNKENPVSESEAVHHQNLTSNFEVVNSATVSQSLILPQQANFLSERQLQTIKLDSVSGDDTMQSADIILHQDISQLADEKSVHDISVIPGGGRKSQELKEK